MVHWAHPAGRRVGPVVLGLLLAVPLAVAAPPAVAIDIMPHRALYSLSLGAAKSASGVADARGSMLLEWGDSCDGWTIEQRYKLTVLYTENGEAELSVSFTTWESRDGLRYRFFVRKLRDGDVTDELRGRASLSGPGEAGSAAFTQPEQQEIPLPAGAIFPTEHTIEIIRAAEAGKRFLSRSVFDGGELEGPSEITAAIGGRLPAAAPDAVAPAKAEPFKRPSWPVRLAYYKQGSNGSEPDYEVGMRLHDNGVADGLALDYGDFSVKARLTEIEALPRPSC
ncbi:MAG: cell envelope integrity EipB family protein [Proteobacteria bacterium]|nr:cell envelope integrity EipB family protein [Pseudomonadota bacterium]MBI3495784.1 cell envelope integrity EipB family protein [Pseudomonadota bacterium]